MPLIRYVYQLARFEFAAIPDYLASVNCDLNTKRRKTLARDEKIVKTRGQFDGERPVIVDADSLAVSIATMPVNQHKGMTDGGVFHRVNQPTFEYSRDRTLSIAPSHQ